MKIPNKIDKLLEKRAKAAMEFIAADAEISKWLDSKDIIVSPDDINTGACSLLEPYSSIEHIREAILDK